MQPGRGITSSLKKISRPPDARAIARFRAIHGPPCSPSVMVRPSGRPPADRHAAMAASRVRGSCPSMATMTSYPPGSAVWQAMARRQARSFSARRNVGTMTDALTGSASALFGPIVDSGMFLHAPHNTDTQRADRRTHPRHALTRPCKVYHDPTGRYAAGETADLSRAGALIRVQSPRPWNPGDEVKLFLAWSDRSVLTSRDAIIARVVRAATLDGDRRYVGIEFETVLPEQVAAAA